MTRTVATTGAGQRVWTPGSRPVTQVPAAVDDSTVYYSEPGWSWDNRNVTRRQRGRPSHYAPLPDSLAGFDAFPLLMPLSWDDVGLAGVGLTKADLLDVKPRKDATWSLRATDNGDGTFTPTHDLALLNDVLTGDGSAENPFVIEEVNFPKRVVVSDFAGAGWHITFRRCHIQGSGSWALEYDGIRYVAEDCDLAVGLGYMLAAAPVEVRGNSRISRCRMEWGPDSINGSYGVVEDCYGRGRHEWQGTEYSHSDGVQIGAGSTSGLFVVRSTLIGQTRSVGGPSDGNLAHGNATLQHVPIDDNYTRIMFMDCFLQAGNYGLHYQKVLGNKTRYGAVRNVVCPSLPDDMFDYQPGDVPRADWTVSFLREGWSPDSAASSGPDEIDRIYGHLYRPDGTPVQPGKWTV